MCAILDASAVGDVFGSDSSETETAARKFFEWIDAGDGQLAVGGKVLDELDGNSTKFREWRQEAALAGRIIRVDKIEIAVMTEKLKKEKACRSNDQHVIALAQVSGARLLCANDGDLQKDFKDKNLINPRGRVYSTVKNKKLGKRPGQIYSIGEKKAFDQSHRSMLNGNLCAGCQ